jgi:peptide/nickel transport system permease protein
MDMRGFLARKAVYLAITLFAIVLTNFILFRIMPGDPVRAFIPRGISPEAAEAIRARFHLDQPLLTQFFYYLGDLVTLDFGITSSYYAGTEVGDILVPRLFNTLLLMTFGTAIAVFAGISLGRFIAWRRGSAVDTLGLTFALTFYTMPTFVLALALVIFFGGTLNMFPLKGPYGEIPFYDNPPDYSAMSLIEKIVSRGYHLVLPVLAFSIQWMADFVLIMRNSLTDVLTEDYIMTARAKGLSDEDVLKHHAMRNALLPVVTVAAITIGWVVGGEIMVELIFSYEGIGQLTYDAVYYRDFPLLQALFLLMSLGVLFANFIADLIYTRLDPRVKI